MVPLLYVLLLAGLTAAELNNVKFDKQLELYNNATNYLIPLTLDRRLSIGPFILSDGVLIGDNSRYRVGDVVVRREDNGSLYTETGIGWRLLVFAFGRIDYNGRTMSGLFRVRESEFHMSYFLNKNATDCSVLVEHFHFHDMGKVTFQSSLAELDGMDFSDTVARLVHPKVNDYFEYIRLDFQKGLEGELCRGDLSGDNIQKFTILGLSEYYLNKQ